MGPPGPGFISSARAAGVRMPIFKSEVSAAMMPMVANIANLQMHGQLGKENLE